MAQLVKNPPHNGGDQGSIPGLGRYPGEGKGCPFQYSGLEKSMDTVHVVAKSQTGLTFTFLFTFLLRHGSVYHPTSVPTFSIRYSGCLEDNDETFISRLKNTHTVFHPYSLSLWSWPCLPPHNTAAPTSVVSYTLTDIIHLSFSTLALSGNWVSNQLWDPCPCLFWHTQNPKQGNSQQIILYSSHWLELEFFSQFIIIWGEGK